MICADTPLSLRDVVMHTRLRLAPNVGFEVQEHRGQVLAIVHEPTQNIYFKASLAVKALLSQLDGSSSLSELAALQPRLAPVIHSEQALEIILQLLEAKVLFSDLPANVEWDMKRNQQHTRRAQRARWLKPWLLKIPLVNPDRLLDKLNRTLGGIWSPLAFVIWLTLVMFAAAISGAHWQELTGYWKTRFLDPFNIVLMVLIYPLLKAVHELAHGLTTKKWGGHVYEMGVLFLFFMPIPYVDASASVNLRSKYQRMTVAASGVMAELLCASIAFFVWLSADSILVRDIAINVMLIGVVSSLFFNGNPLLKFDGYYVLSDWLEIPNLSMRSNAYIGARTKSLLFGLPITSQNLRPGEKKWLLSYGLLSGLYRLLVTLAITLFIANHYFFIGSALALIAVSNQLLWPAIRAMRNVWQDTGKHNCRSRLLVVLMGGSALLWLLLFQLPLPQATSAAGILVTAPENQIKAKTSGFLTSVYTADGALVKMGDPLLGFDNAPLLSEIRYLEAMRIEVQTLSNQFIASDPVQAAIYRDELANLDQEMLDLLEQKQGLHLLAGSTGTLRMAGQGQLLGRYFDKGEVIGSIENDRPQVAYAMVVEPSAAAMLGKIQSVQVRLVSYPELTLTGGLVSARPEATRLLPSPYLGSRFGGPIAVNSADPAGREALESLLQYQVEVILPDGIRVNEARVEVKFVHNDQPLGRRLWLWLRQFVLQNLQV